MGHRIDEGYLVGHTQAAASYTHYQSPSHNVPLAFSLTSTQLKISIHYLTSHLSSHKTLHK